MIDLHCHLCFGVDDGPQTEREAVDLAAALVDAGVTQVACTSHVRADKDWFNTAPKQEANQSALRAALDRAQIPLTITTGAEHYLDDTLFAQPLDGYVVPYGASRWLLLELPYSGPPMDLMGQLYRLRKAGYRLLLAHLERFPYVADDDALIQRILDAGHLIQVNLGSLAGAYTRAHKKAARRLVEGGWASVAASDCHEVGDVKRFLLKGRKALEKLVGQEGAQRLMVENPRAILDDHPPERIWP